jgi:hypothetical protein
MFGATGALYAIRRELVPTMPEEILLDDMFIPIATFFRGYRTVMEPHAIAWDVPTSRTDEFPRKVRTLAGNYQLFRHYPRLLMPFANRMWLHFVSYKVARLALPWLLVAVFVSSFFLPTPWNVVIVAAQVAFLLLVLFDSWTVEGSAPKRLTSPARTFFTMMLAGALAVRILFVDARSLWTVTNLNKSA